MPFDATKALALAEQLEQADRAMPAAPWSRTRDNGIHAGKPKRCIGSMYDSSAVVALRNLAADCARALREAAEECERLHDALVFTAAPDESPVVVTTAGAHRTSSNEGKPMSERRPLAFMDPRIPDRHWSKTIPEPNSGCWLWLGARDQKGYGTTTVRCRPWRIHRYFYTMLVGPIPDGLHIDHLCRVRCCVNPAHIEPVTPRENVLRGEGITAIRAAQALCIRGHELSPRAKKGERVCRTCTRAHAKERSLKRKAASALLNQGGAK